MNPTQPPPDCSPLPEFVTTRARFYGYVTKSPALLPCPRCGSAAYIEHPYDLAAEELVLLGGCWVTCSECVLEVGRAGVDTQEADNGSFRTFSEALAYWNERPCVNRSPLFDDLVAALEFTASQMARLIPRLDAMSHGPEGMIAMQTETRARETLDKLKRLPIRQALDRAKQREEGA